MAANRTKTIEYAFDTNIAGLAATTRYDFGSRTLYIPESTSRSFKSVILQVTCRGTETSGTSMTSWLLGITLGAAGASDTTVTDTITHSDEQQTFFFTRDVTSYFNSNFGSGASQTAVASVRFASLPTINITAKLIITYDHDETSHNTLVKTVRLPLDSPLTALTNILTQIGTNQVPNLDTLLPEASKVYRDIWFEVSAMEAAASTADMQLGLALDAEAEALDGNHEEALNTGCWFFYIWRRSDMTTNATHAFKARSTVADTFMHPAITLFVTYEYDESTTTGIMNHIAIPFSNGGGAMGGSVIGDQSRIQIKVPIQEPGTIALKQSGVYLCYTARGASGVFGGPIMSIGTQSTRTYTTVSNTNSCGQSDLIQRFDSGAIAGQGVSLVRGDNYININMYRTTTSSGVLGPGAGGVLYLNYTSGKSTSGSGAHNMTRIWDVQDTAADEVLKDTGSFAPTVLETNYNNTAIGFSTMYLDQATGRKSLSITAEITSTEPPGDGWIDLHTSAGDTESENSLYCAWYDASKIFYRNSSEFDKTRLNPVTARKYRVLWGAAIGPWFSMMMYHTYHSITYTVAGRITGYTGTGSDIDVLAYRVDTKSIVQSGVTTSGVFSLIHFDNTISVYTEARQDSTHMGRSDNNAAT